MMRFLVPLVLFAVLGGFLYVGLKLNPREVPSPFINKAAPDFKLSQLQDFQATFSPKDNLGKVWMLNVWASWCVACRDEHPLLVAFSKKGLLPIYGLNYKDQRDDGNAWLMRMGNPYQASLFDNEGRVGIASACTACPRRSSSTRPARSA